MSKYTKSCEVWVDELSRFMCGKSPCVYSRFCKDHIDEAISYIKSSIIFNDNDLEARITLHKDKKRNYEVWITKLTEMKNETRTETIS